MIALLAGSAFAVNWTVCAKVNPFFTDSIQAVSGNGNYLLDDFFNDNTTHEPLRGVKITLENVVTHATAVKYATASGSNAGCADFSLTNGMEFQVQFTSIAETGDGNILKLYVRDGSPILEGPKVLYGKTFSNTFVVDANDPDKTTTRTINAANAGGTPWQHFGVMAWALNHRDGGMSNQVFTAYGENGADECDGADVCFNSVVDAVYLDVDGPAQRRNITVHELGHQVAYRKIGSSGNDDGYVPDDGICWGNSNPDSHELQTKETDCTAFSEAIAHFYAVITFNNQSEDDAFYEYYKTPDWDVDGDQDPLSVNLMGIPWEDASGNLIDAADLTNDAAVTTFSYFEDATGPLACDDPVNGGTDVTANRNMEYDYVRMLWHQYYFDGLSYATMLDIMALAEPDDFLCLDEDDPALDPLEATGWTWSEDQLPWAQLIEGAAFYDAIYFTSIEPQWDGWSQTQGLNHP